MGLIQDLIAGAIGCGVWGEHDEHGRMFIHCSPREDMEKVTI